MSDAEHEDIRALREEVAFLRRAALRDSRRDRKRSVHALLWAVLGGGLLHPAVGWGLALPALNQFEPKQPILASEINENFDILSSALEDAADEIALAQEKVAPSGAILAFAGSREGVPDGWLVCDGAEVPRTGDTKNLFEAIGIAYGPGDGINTFNLPDLRSRFLVGADAGIGLTNREVGTKGGEEEHVLTIEELPSHTHSLANGQDADGTLTVLTTSATRREEPAIYSRQTTSTGGGAAHNSLPPFVAVTWIIRM